MADKIVAKVRSTKQYGKFILFRGNRGRDKGHFSKLMHSMETHGWIDSLPMTVKPSKTPGKFDVMDGHTRFSAAEELGIPAKYVVVNGEVGDTDIYLINLTQKNWSVTDYVKSYANMGKAHYIQLLEFQEEHKCGLTNAISLLSKYQVCSRASVREGAFEVVDYEWGVDTLSYLKRINAASDYNALKNKFVDAFIICRQVADFDEERLIGRIIKNPDMMVDYHNASDIYQMLERIYNFNLSVKKQVPLSFNIQQFKKNR